MKSKKTVGGVGLSVAAARRFRAKTETGRVEASHVPVGAVTTNKVVRGPDDFSDIPANVKAVPYMKVEYMSGKTHEIVEFCRDGVMQGCTWEDAPREHGNWLSWLVAGAALATAIWSGVFLLG